MDNNNPKSNSINKGMLKKNFSKNFSFRLIPNKEINIIENKTKILVILSEKKEIQVNSDGEISDKNPSDNINKKTNWSIIEN